MGLIDLASSNSLWRGIDYFESNKVKEIEKINDNEYKSIVSGSSDYNVFINLNHPRKSTCSCPFAEGRRVICKHMVATYFKIYPEEAKRLIDEQVAYEMEEEQLYEEHYNEVKEYVDSLTEEEAKAMLIERLIEEWYDDNWYI